MSKTPKFAASYKHLDGKLRRDDNSASESVNEDDEDFDSENINSSDERNPINEFMMKYV